MSTATRNVLRPGSALAHVEDDEAAGVGIRKVHVRGRLFEPPLRYSPAAPSFSRSRSAGRAEVFPVCRAAYKCEVGLEANQVRHAGQAHPVQRRHAVVLVRPGGAGGVESAHALNVAPPAWGRNQRRVTGVL